MTTTSTSATPSRSRPAVVRRWAPWVVIAVIVVAAGVVGLQRSNHPSLDQRTLSVAGQVRCPVCNGQSVAQSDAPPSLAVRDRIRTELTAGEAPQQILTGIVNSYGPGILEKPPAKGVGLIVWMTPILAVAGAVIGLVLAFRRWRPTPVGGQGASDTDRELVGQALRDAPDGRERSSPDVPS
ncbi:MAG: cytochrome c-type biogenesis protein CcmH [Actinomycetota bacterium]|nr:cytochrome c-type biogenesis protein CcmH [Actinomycetota bacterium]